MAGQQVNQQWIDVPSDEEWKDVTPISGSEIKAPLISSHGIGEEKSGALRNIAAFGLRGLSGLVPGGPLGALSSGAGELGAELIEGRGLNPKEILAAGTIGAIPFGREASIGRSMLKGGALGGTSDVIQHYAQSGNMPDLRELLLSSGIGAAGGGITGAISKGLERTPEEILTKPKMRLTPDGNFEDVNTGQLFDKSGNKIMSISDKLSEAMKGLKEKVGQQGELYTKERAERFGKVGGVKTEGVAGYHEELSHLSGDYPKVEIDKLKLNPEEADSLFNHIKETIPDKPTSIRARGAVEKLMNGELPQSNELDLLDQYLSLTRKVPGSPKILASQSKLRDMYELARGFMSVDLPFMTSAATRQAAPLAFSKRWFQSYVDAAKSFSSENIYNNIMDEVEKSPIHQRKFIGGKVTTIADELGLKSSDLKTITSREEQIRSQLAERIPGYGKYVRASNRAFTAFMNTVKTRTAEDWLNAAGAIDKNGNIIDEYTGKILMNTLNELSGHGSLKVNVPFSRFGTQKEVNLENAADKLSLVFWSPRLLARDARMMNPMNYILTNKLDRMKYLEGAIRRAGVWAGFTGLAALGGAKVNFDPTSSDFGKAKIGNTRLDAGSGLLQWIVMSARQALGESTSSASGKTTELGSSTVAPTRWDVANEFLKNRIHPTLGIAVSAANATKRAPFYPGSELAEKFTPIPASDLIDLMKSNPDIRQILMGLVGSSLSLGASTYGPREYGKPQFNIPGDVPFRGGKLIPSH